MGTNKGQVQVWDVSSNKKLSVLEGHSARVGALAWSGDTVSSGSRDRHILQRDVRISTSGAPVRHLLGHRQEVSSLSLCVILYYIINVAYAHFSVGIIDIVSFFTRSVD